MTSEAAQRISDLQFTHAYRGRVQYSRRVREHLGRRSFNAVSSGVTVDPTRRQCF